MINNLRGLIFAAAIGLINTSYAQSLDIGGVELALGQSEGYAREQLSKFYNVSIPIDQTQRGSYHHVIDWSNKNKPKFIGGVYFAKGKLTIISKDYLEHINNPNFSFVYAIASADLEAKGGKKCTYKESSQEPTSSFVDKKSNNQIGYIHQIQKICGAYKLTLTMPTLINEDVISPSLTMSLSAP